MSDKCAYPKCGKELTHLAGRKKKKYCDATCKVADWQRLNPIKKEPKQKRISIAKWMEIEKKLNSNGRDNQFENAARGRDTNGVNNDEVKSQPNQQLITQYEEELTRLGTSQIAKERGKWLTKRIYELKYPNKND